MNGVRVLAAAHPPELAVVVRMSDADPRTYRVAAARGGARCLALLRPAACGWSRRSVAATCGAAAFNELAVPRRDARSSRMGRVAFNWIFY